MADFNENTKYIYIRIDNLHFDEYVADMVEKQQKKFPVKLLDNIFYSGGFKLNQDRLDRVLEGYINGIELPPIQVKKEFGKYIVLDGRHRICASIIHDRETIKCVIIN